MAQRPIATALRQLERLVEDRAHDVSDGQLLQRFLAQHEEAAFATLVRRHGPMVLSVGRRLLNDAHAAEDVCQATFLVLARKAGSIRKHGSLGSWLHGVAWRSARKLRERRGRSAQTAALPDQADARAADPGAVAAWHELLAILDEEVAALPERLRAPLVLCCLEDLSHSEAAARLGWPVGTVKTRVAKAREVLRDRLAGRGLALPAGTLATVLAVNQTSAAIPAQLAHSIIVAALTATKGKIAAGIVSAEVARLVEEALATTAVGHFKIAGAALVAVGFVVSGFGIWGQRPTAENEPPARTAQGPNVPAASAPVDVYGDALPPGALARMGTMRLRHSNATSLAFSSDNTLVTAGNDKTIRFWDAASGRLLREQRLPSQRANFSVVNLSPDGRLVAYEENVATVILLDIAANVVRHTLSLVVPKWEHRLQNALFSPDGKMLVTAQHNGVLRVWDVATGQGRDLGKHSDRVDDIFMSAGTLVSASMIDRTMRFWDLATAREQKHLEFPHPYCRAVVSPDGRIVAVKSFSNADVDQGMAFWDSNTGKPAKDWIAPKLKYVHPVRYTPDGKTVLIGQMNEILVWDPIAGKAIRSLRDGLGWYADIVFSPNRQTVAALSAPGNGQGTVAYIWDIATGRLLAPKAFEQGHQGDVNGLALAPDGRTVASLSWDDDTVRIWEATTGRQLHRLPVEKLLAKALQFSPDGRVLFVGTRSAIIAWDVRTGRELQRYPISAERDGGGQYLSLMSRTDNGQKLLAVSANGNGANDERELHTWDVATGKKLSNESFRVNEFGWGRFSDDGRLLALPSGSIRDGTSGKELFHLSMEDKRFSYSLPFSHDGTLAAASVMEKVRAPNAKYSNMQMVGVRVWELATRLPVRRLETGPVAHMSFTQDGRRMVTAGPDAIQTWDLVTGKMLVTRQAPGTFCGLYGPSFASSFALSGDGRVAVTGHADSTVLLWDLSQPAVERSAAPLSAAELEACWADLAGDDAGAAFVAVSRLADVPEQSVPLLRDRLRPATAVPENELRQLIAQLDSTEFAGRQSATKRLQDLEEFAQPALRQALREKPTLELRRRVEALVVDLCVIRSPESRRHLRALRILEQIPSAEARQVLERLANGTPEAYLTQEAKAALERLAKR